MSEWKFTDATRLVVSRTRDDGSLESCVADREDVLAWVAKGNVIEEPDAVVPTKDEVDAAAARADEKLSALAAATPAQIRAWVNNNFPSLTPAERDKLGTAFVVLCVLARRL